jgi:hypothetical protein
MVFTAFVATVLLAGSLLVPAAIVRSEPRPLPEGGATLPAERKDALLRPLVSTATECIARSVSADPRFPVLKDPADINNLIVEAVPSCVDDLRSMIDTYDRLYGDGTGDMFFMGPYLDGLPAAVTIRVKSAR